jgi:hypothetical protein
MMPLPIIQMAVFFDFVAFPLARVAAGAGASAWRK